MLLKQEKVKKYITSGEEVDGYVYRKPDSNELWFVALQNESKPYFHSRLVGTKIYNCSYFVHKNLEEVDGFVKHLIEIEKYIIEKELPFQNFIALYWNPITDFLLFNTKEVTEENVITYLDKLIKNWNTKLEKYRKEFDILISKKREKWDEYSIWDDDKLYELERVYNFEIPEDVKKSKNSVMLESMIENADKLLDKLKNE